MKKTAFFRKAAIVIAAALASCALSLSVSAVDIDTGAVTVPDSSSDNEVTIPKGLSFINTDSVTAYGPGIHFQYKVEPVEKVEGTDSITSDGTTTVIYPGHKDGVLFKNSSEGEENTDTAEVVFGTDENYASNNAEGKETQKNLTLVVDLDKIGNGQPGIYRYVITDVTTKEALYNAGIVRPDNYDTTRYLDVFVKRVTAEDDKQELKVSGYVLRKEQNSETKDQGFVKPAAGTTSDNDAYRSYNVTVTKLVTGAMGDTAYDFPFAASVNNNAANNNDENIKFFSGKDSSALTETSDKNLSFTLHSGEIYYLRGLSPKALVSYTETNDTNETYTVKIDGRSSPEGVYSDFTKDTDWFADDENKTYTLKEAAITDYDAANRTGEDATVANQGQINTHGNVRYTNTLNAVSPTGIVLRFAPFILIAVFGVIFFIASRKTGEKKKEADII